MRILEDGSTTGHRLGVGEITCRPIPTDRPSTATPRHDEGFYVVSGSNSFTVGETTHHAPAGTPVMVPPGSAYLRQPGR
jgi:mannose-6-phosphate isomerase-like protein (cupin superfamily)